MAGSTFTQWGLTPLTSKFPDLCATARNSGDEYMRLGIIMPNAAIATLALISGHGGRLLAAVPQDMLPDPPLVLDQQPALASAYDDNGTRPEVSLVILDVQVFSAWRVFQAAEDHPIWAEFQAFGQDGTHWPSSETLVSAAVLLGMLDKEGAEQDG